MNTAIGYKKAIENAQRALNPHYAPEQKKFLDEFKTIPKMDQFNILADRQRAYFEHGVDKHFFKRERTAPDAGNNKRHYKIILQKKGNPVHYSKLDTLLMKLSELVGRKINRSTFSDCHNRIECFKNGVTQFQFSDGKIESGYYVTDEYLQKMVSHLTK